MPTITTKFEYGDMVWFCNYVGTAEERCCECGGHITSTYRYEPLVGKVINITIEVDENPAGHSIDYTLEYEIDGRTRSGKPLMATQSALETEDDSGECGSYLAYATKEECRVACDRLNAEMENEEKTDEG